MNYEIGCHPGAVWKKTDFEIHTPRDPNWAGSHLPGGETHHEEAREKWAKTFVAECRSRGLMAIAITDHHDFCLLPYVRRQLESISEPERPWLFPGVEITCDDSAQCLLLFDVDSKPDLWQRIYGKMPRITAAGQDDATSPAAELCGKGLQELIKEISDDDHLRPATIILPHAGDEGSHKTIIRTGMHTRFRELQVDGFYAGKGYVAIKPITKSKIYGEIREWGNRRRGLITTGDNRSATYEQLGINPCWMKLGEPTTESIRQALLADQARISYDSPIIPAQRIIERRVDSTLTGNNFRLIVNDGFNAVIGGRGSGKSAVLEYLRFGIGRSSIEVQLSDEETKRERSLLTDTLKGGKVTVVLERDGVIETWTRTGDTRDSIEIRTQNGQVEVINISAAQQRFRSRAFSQKQLSTLVIASKAEDQITGIAAAESIIKRQELDDAIARIRREIQAGVQQQIESWVAEADHKNASAATNDLNRRIEATQKKLEQSGLSVESQAVLNAAPLYRAASSLLSELDNTLAKELRSLEQKTDPLESVGDSRWSKVSGFSEFSEVVQETQKTREVITAAYDRIKDAIVDLQAHLKLAGAKFETRNEKFRESHGVAAAQQAALASQIQELDRLNIELQEFEGRERLAEQRASQLSDSSLKLSASRRNLKTQLISSRQLLESAAQKVAAMSNNALKAEVRQEALPKQYVDALQLLCENQRVRDLVDKCEKRTADILQMGDDEWSRVCDSLISLLKARVQAGITPSEPSEESKRTLQSALFELTDQQTLGIYNALTAEKLAGLLMAAPAEFIAFEYRDGSQYIPFEKASPGQQAAALLNLLLQQEAGTLIIDQPEDDLDNRVIMDIVRLLQTAKQKRQLIFATHNANFVVNGDADKVIALSSIVNREDDGSTPRIAIELDGAIETPNVSKLIAETVEGGQKAFELRRRKYKITTTW